VNLQEGEKIAKKFIDNNSIKNLEVVLDADGKIGEAYEAFSIPRTVIVDKDGIVQAIHRGFSPNLKEDIKKDLDAILKGKTPAS
jgi:peroxiredoxin